MGRGVVLLASAIRPYATEDRGSTGNWGSSRTVPTSTLETGELCFELGNTLLEDLCLAESFAIVVGTLALAAGSDALLTSRFGSITFELAFSTVETDKQRHVIEDGKR